MKEELPKRIENSFLSKLKKIFRNIFVLKRKPDENCNDISSSVDKSIENIQKEYEEGKIFADDMSDKQYESLVALYTEQLKNINAEILEKENKLKKNII